MHETCGMIFLKNGFNLLRYNMRKQGPQKLNSVFPDTVTFNHLLKKMVAFQAFTLINRLNTEHFLKKCKASRTLKELANCNLS